MPAHDIPRNEWPAFLTAFGRQHEGWLATVELREPFGASIMVNERPLRSADAKIDPRGEARIALIFGHHDGGPMTEIADVPQQLRFLETEEHAHVGLEIESAKGRSLILRFRSPMPPEMVDGIAA
jgi:hypothetical protein